MHILLLLFLVGCGVAVKSGWDHATAERKKGRDARIKEAGKKFPGGKLPKSRHKAVASRARDRLVDQGTARRFPGHPDRGACGLAGARHRS